MVIDVKHELAQLTTVDDLAINRVFDKVIWCISDGIEQGIKRGNQDVDFDLGFGILKVKATDSEVKYKFVPSKHLESAVIDTVVNEQNRLEIEIEKSLVSKLTKIYKDMF